MRRYLTWAAIILVVVLIAIQFIPVNRTNPTPTQEIKWDSPTTRALAKRACFDCHSDEVTWPWDGYIAPVSWYIANHVAEGKQRLNFSEWDKPNSEANEIIRSVQNGSMPLQSYTLLHPSARLSQSEKDQLIAGLTATLQQDPPIPGRRRRG